MKNRYKPMKLAIYEKLAIRKLLTDREKRETAQLKKGLDGEQIFDSYVEKLPGDHLVINDLLLKHNDRIFQIDALLIKNGKLYLYEIKNYKGEYYYEENRLFKEPNIEIDNPLLQLHRTESLLRQLLAKRGFEIPIESAVVFINSEFTLYQAPRSTDILLSTFLNHYFSKFNHHSTIDPKFHRLATMLHAQRLKDSPYTQYPTYDYAELKKGIYCSSCFSFLIKIKGHRCICETCLREEFVVKAILRHVEEYHLLFPFLKITTAAIHDWCHIITSKKRIRRTLDQHLQRKGKNQMTYYEFRK